MRSGVLSLLLTCLSLSVLSQKFLVLEKTGTRKRFQFFHGETIKYQVKGERFFREDVITELVDNVIVFDYGFYTLDQINAIVVKGKKTRVFQVDKYGPYFIVAGALFLIADGVNPETKIDENTLVIAGALAGTGVLLMLSIRNKVKIRGNWRLRIVDI